MIKKDIYSDAIRFLIAGGINTLLTLIIYQLGLLIMPHGAAYGISWLVGITFLLVFYPTRVFPESNNTWLGKALITLLYISNFFLSLWLLNKLVILGIQPQFAIFFVLVSATIINFLGMREILRRGKIIKKESRTIKKEMIKVEDRFVEIWKENNPLFLYLIVIGCVLFSYELFNFSLTVDEEIQIRLTTTETVWIQQGRWGMYLISALLLPNPVIPVVPIFIAIIFSASAYIVVMKLFSNQNSTAQYIAAPLFIGCPTLYYAYHFSTLSYGIGIGFFTAAIGNYIYFHSSNKNKLWAILPFSFSIAIYQAFLLFICILFLLNLLNNILSNRKHSIYEMTIEIAYFSGILFLSLILYFGASEFFLFISDLSKSNYTSNFFNYSNSLTYWKNTIPATLDTMAAYYLGQKNIYGNSIYSLSALLAISIGSIFIRAFKTNHNSISKVSALFILVAIIFMPFLLNFMNNGSMPTRALIGLPVVLSGIVYFGWIYSNKSIQYVIGTITIFTTLQFMVSNNKLAFTNQLSWEADKMLAIRLQGRIDELGIDTNAPVPLEVVGVPRNRPANLFPTSETIGNSFFSFVGGNVYRIILFLNTLALSNFQAATLQERGKIMEKVTEMPVWPKRGSIAFHDKILVIKFGDYTFQQHHALCGIKGKEVSACSANQ